MCFHATVQRRNATLRLIIVNILTELDWFMCCGIKSCRVCRRKCKTYIFTSQKQDQHLMLGLAQKLINLIWFNKLKQTGKKRHTTQTAKINHEQRSVRFIQEQNESSSIHWEKMLPVGQVRLWRDRREEEEADSYCVLYCTIILYCVLCIMLVLCVQW